MVCNLRLVNDNSGILITHKRVIDKRFTLIYDQ